MSDKKLPKIKHNHTLTDILKASIFSLVMMAPVTAIGVTCAYVVCNKNAYQSYSGQDLDHYDTLTNINQVELNKNYHFSSIPTYDNASNVSSGNIVYSNITNINTTDNDFLTKLPLGRYFIYYARVDQRQLYVYDEENNLLMSRSVFTQTLEFDFTLDAYNTTYFPSTLKSFSIKTQTNNSYMDNVFYYAVDTMQNNTLFSWTKTTAIYTPVNAMTTGMGINTPAIAVLLVYWLLCTAVYIIIDIVVKGFTWLTHLIGER